eukprot:scaffold4298_cov183-Amphora_coffeaeformis.AAC.12
MPRAAADVVQTRESRGGTIYDCFFLLAFLNSHNIAHISPLQCSYSFSLLTNVNCQSHMTSVVVQREPGVAIQNLKKKNTKQHTVERQETG